MSPTPTFTPTSLLSRDDTPKTSDGKLNTKTQLIVICAVGAFILLVIIYTRLIDRHNKKLRAREAMRHDEKMQQSQIATIARRNTMKTIAVKTTTNTSQRTRMEDMQLKGREVERPCKAHTKLERERPSKEAAVLMRFLRRGRGEREILPRYTTAARVSVREDVVDNTIGGEGDE